MIKFLRSDYEFHFFGKPYSAFFFEYGKTKLNFGEEQYNLLLKGKTFAIHLGDKHNHSSYFVFDVDGPNDGGATAHPTALKLKTHLEKCGFTPTIFYSGSKGYHLYVFFDRVYPVNSLRRFAIDLLASFQIPDNIEIEVFPKNGEIDYEKGKYGNHLKAPLSIHPKTNVRSEQLTDYAVNIKVLELNKKENIREIEQESIEELYKSNGIENNIDKQVAIVMLADSVAPYFTSGDRHRIALGLSGHLKTNGIDKEITIAVFSRLIELSGGDRSDIYRVIEDTYTSTRIVAELGLADLPDEVEKSIYAYTTGQSPQSLKFDINNIRSTKRQPHIKVDLSATKTIEYINKRYRIFHDDNFIYVIDGDKIYSNLDTSFESLLIEFGLNTEESFGRQVRKVVLDYLYLNSVYTNPINFCEFKNGKISIYTRDSIVSVTDNVLTTKEFLPVLNKKDFKYIEYRDRKISLRSFLKKFELKPKDNDLILAWLVTQMFNESINTKPVLLIQGQPQAGKSTLANFLMRMIEDRKSEVVAYTGKDDALIASLQKHKVLVMDNLEFITGKTLDLINAVVTGAVIELRALYTTNNVARIKPTSSLVITSAHGSFDNDGAFQSRLIKVRLFDRSGFAVESVFWKQFEDCYNDLVSDLLDMCSLVIKEKNKQVQAKEENEELKKYRIRMTDFIDISNTLLNNNIIRTDIEQSLLEEQERDKYQTPYLDIFRKIRFKEELYHPFTIKEIYPRYRAVASTYGIEKLTSVNLGQRLLKTGIFTVTSAGFFRLLQPIYCSLENSLD